MYNFLMKNQIWIIIILLVAVIIYLIFNSKFRAKVYNLIAQAEVGNISRESLIKTIDKVQEGDLDDRMVLVMASIVQLVPVLNIIPKSILVPFLNKYVQKAFDRIKLALKTVPKNATVAVQIDVQAENISNTIVSKLDDFESNKEIEETNYVDNNNYISKDELSNRLKDVFGRVKIAQIQKEHIEKELLK